MDIKERMLQILMESYTPIPITGCWIWTRAWNPNKYGKLTTSLDGKIYQGLVHRIAYELLIGPIPDGFVVCHKCDTPPCYNPLHLFCGSQQTNIVDAINKERRGKLNKMQVHRILTGNERPLALAKEFNVSAETIYAVRRKLTYKERT